MFFNIVAEVVKFLRDKFEVSASDCSSIKPNLPSVSEYFETELEELNGCGGH